MTEDDKISFFWLCIAILITTMVIDRCSGTTRHISISITKNGVTEVTQH